MNCTPTKEQHIQFFKKIVIDLLAKHKSENPVFDLKSYVIELHDLVLDATRDKDTALAYTALIPDYIFKARGQSRTAIAKLIPSDGEIIELAASFDSDVQNVSDYVFGKALDQKVITKIMNTEPSAGVSIPKLTGRRLKDAIEASNSAIPLTMLAGTGQDSKIHAGEWTGVPKANMLRTMLVRTRMVLEMQVKELNDASELLYSHHRGFKLRLINETELPENSAPLDDENGIVRARNPEYKVLVITDNDGNYISFDEKGNIDEKGQVIHMTFREANKPTIENHKTLIKQTLARLEKLLTAEKRSKVAITAEIAAKKKQLEDKMAAEIIAIEDILSNFNTNYKNSPDKKLLLNITGGSTGIIQDPLDKEWPRVSTTKITNKELRTLSYINAGSSSIQLDGVNRPLIVSALPLDHPDFNEHILNIINVLRAPLSDTLSNVDKIAYFKSFVYVGTNTNKTEAKVTLKDVDGKLHLIIKSKQYLFDIQDVTKATVDKLYETLVNSGLFFNLQKLQQYTEINIVNGIAIKNTNAPYTDLLRKYTKIQALPNKDGNFIELNGYFTIDHIPEQRIEETVEKAVKKASVIEEIDADDIPLETNRLITLSTTPEQHKIADKWWANSPLSKIKHFRTGELLIPLERLTNIVNSNAFATWSLAGIKLYNGSDSTHLYHESWHAFSQLFLTKEDKNNLYAETAKLKGTFTVVERGISADGDIVPQLISIEFGKATKRQLEEYIAEEFRKFAIAKGDTKGVKGSMKSVFTKIWEFLKAFFKGVTLQDTINDIKLIKPLNDMFNALYVGDINHYSPKVENVSFSIANAGMISIGDVDSERNYADSKLIKESIDGLLSEEINNENLKPGSTGFTIRGLTHNKNKIVLYARVKNRIYEKYAELLNVKKLTLEATLKSQNLTAQEILDYNEQWDSVNGTLQAIFVTKPNILNKVSEALPVSSLDELQVLSNNIELLHWTYVNMGTTEEIKEAVENFSPNKATAKGVVGYHLLNSAFNDLLKASIKEDSDEDSPDKEMTSQTDRTGYGDKGPNASDPFEDADKQVIYLIKSLIKQDRERNNILNSLGFPTLVDYNMTKNELEKKIFGTPDMGLLYEKIVNEGGENPLYRQLAQKLGVPGVHQTPEQNMLWLKFTQVCSRTIQPLISLTMETRNIVDEETGSVISGTTIAKVGKTYGDVSKVKTAWETEFKMAIPSSTNFILKNNENSNYLDLPKIVDTFIKESTVDKNSNFITYELKLTDPVSVNKFLKAIGINITDTIKNLTDVIKIEGFVTDLNFIVNNIAYLNNVVEEKLQIKNPVEVLTTNKVGLRIILNNGKRESRNIPVKGQRGFIDAIARIEIENSNRFSSTMKVTPSGELQSEIAKGSSISRSNTAMQIVSNRNDFSNPDGNAAHMTHLNDKNNPQAKHSIIVNSLYLQDGDRTGTTIQLVNLPGTSDIVIEGNNRVEEGLSHATMNISDKFISDYTMALTAGVFPHVTTGGKSTHYATKLSRLKTYDGKKQDYLYIDTKECISDLDGKHTGFDRLVTILLPKIQGELEKMLKYEMDKGIYDNYKGFSKETTGNFAIFDDILEENTKNALKRLTSEQLTKGLYPHNATDEQIKSYNNNKDVKLEVILASSKEGIELLKDIKAELRYYFDELYSETKTLLADRYGYTTQQIRESIAENTDLDPTDIVDIAKIDAAALRSFVYNNWINNQEIIFLHNGDISIYDHTKDEATKRFPLFQSAGNIFLTDPISKSIINKKGSPLTEATQLKYGITNIDNSYTGTFNTAVIVDNYQTRKFVNDNLRDKFKRDFENQGYRGVRLNDALYGVGGSYEKVKKGGAMYAYVNQTTTDGQAYITFDAYRTLKIAESKWSPDQEDLYQRIIKGENPSLADTIEFFPVYKLQYAGSLKTEEGLLPVTAAHKFALYPLIPNVVEGGPLQELHEEMMKQGVHYVTHDSGSKLGSITSHSNKKGKPENDVVFDEASRHFIEGSKFTKNTIYLEYLKNQTEVNSQFKGASMMSTQLRTLLSMGLVENGVPVDFLPTETNRKFKWDELSKEEKQKNKFHRLVTNYEKRVGRLVALKKEELLSKIGWVKGKNGRYTGELNTLIDYFKKQLVGQGLSEHELKYIEYSGKQLVRDLSGSPIADTIEKKLMSILDKKIRRQTVTGEPLVEVSVANTMKFDNHGIDKDLKFYTADVEGEKVTTGCQIRIALQGSFENLFNVNDNEGIPIAQYDIIDGKKVLNAENSRLRLNELIQDEDWLNRDNNRNKIRLTGVRIPVQGHNSMEFMEVAEFLPPQAGNIIILPQEIVAKSGTDFDVDKLTSYMPTIGKTGKWLFDEFKTREELDIEIDKVKIKLDTLLKGKKSKGALILNLKLKRDIIKNNNKELIPDVKAFLRDANAISILSGRLEDLMKSTDDGKSLDIITSFSKIPGKLSGKKMVSTYETLVKNAGELKKLRAELKEGFDDQSNYLDENPDIKKINDRYSDLKDQKRNFIKAVENSLINDIVSILELPENAIRLLTANDTNKTEHLADEMEEFVSDQDFKKSKRASKINKVKGISPTRLMEYPYLLKKHEAAFVSKEALGIAAKGNKGNSIYNSAGAYIPSEVPFKIGFDTDEVTLVTTRLYLKTNKIEVVENDKVVKVISLSSLKDADNNYEIAEIISQLMNGYVDAEKNAWIANIQGNKEVTPIILFLLEAGTPIRDIVYYVSNPLIRAYIQEFKTNKGILTKFKNPKNTIEKAKSNAKKHVWKEILGRKYNLPNLINSADGLHATYGDKAWDTDTLKTIAETHVTDVTQNETAISGFLHYLYIEELTRNMNTPRNITEFDTNKSQTFFDIRSKQLAIDEAYTDTRWPKEILDYITEFSPISEFQLTELVEDLFFPLFKTRTDDVLDKYIIDILKDYTKTGLIKSRTGMTKDIFPARFKNALTTYTFVNNLKSFSLGKSDFYSGMPVSYINTGDKSIEVKKVNGVDTILINENLLRREYKNKEFTKNAEGPSSYSAKGYSVVDPIFFYKEDSDTGSKDYFNFVIAREYLRSIKPMEEFKKTHKFKSTYTRLAPTYNQKKNETAEQNEEKVSKKIYEDYLRSKALENSYNFTSMFFNNPEQQEIVSYATTLMSLIKKYDKNDVLKNKFSILQQIEPSYYSEANDKVTNPYGKNLVNITLKDAGSLNADSVEQYADDLTKLADPKIDKWVVNTDEAREDNERFSELFAKFPIYIFLQGGMNKNQFAFPSIFPTESKQSVIMNDAINKTSGKITKEMLDHVFEMFLVNNNPNTKKFNQRQAGPNSVEKRNTDVVKQVPLSISERVTPTSAFGVHTINMKGLTAAIAQELVEEYQSKAYFITNSEVFNEASLKLRITVPEIIKLTPETLVKTKEGIDKDLNAMVTALGNGLSLIFNETGYGHNILNITPDMTQEQIKLNRELYNYLSDKLLERIGYNNIALPTTNVVIKLIPGAKIINDEDIGYFKKFKGTLPTEFFTSKTVFKEFFNEATGKKEKAPQSSKWILNSNKLYDLTDMDSGEVYITNVDLSTGIKMEKPVAKIESVKSTETVDSIMTRAGAKKTSKGMLEIDGQHYYLEMDKWSVVAKGVINELYIYPNGKDGEEIYIGKTQEITKIYDPTSKKFISDNIFNKLCQ